MNTFIQDWPRKLQYLVTTFLVVLTIGVTIGLVYVQRTASSKPSVISEHYRGSEIVDELEIPEKFPKTINDLLLTTHTHVISFAVIFLLLGCLTFFSSIFKGWLKTFFIIEPMVSSCITFIAIWGIRFISPIFGYVAMASGTLMYLSFYVIIAVLLIESIPQNARE